MCVSFPKSGKLKQAIPKKEGQHPILCVTTCFPHSVCDLWKHSWKTGHHSESFHSLLQNELVSDWGKANCSPLGHESVLRNKNFGFSHGKQINFLPSLKLSFQRIWCRHCSRDERSGFWDQDMTPLCGFCGVLHSKQDSFSKPPKTQETEKKNPEAGDLLPYSFKTSIPHSNAIKISSQIKEARHLYAESDHMQVSFLQENKIRQPNTPCDRLVLFLTRFKVGRPLVPRREAVMHIESAKGCQPHSRPGTKFYLSQIQHRFKLRRFTENNLFSPPFRECLFPTCLCPLPSYP